MTTDRYGQYTTDRPKLTLLDYSWQAPGKRSETRPTSLSLPDGAGGGGGVGGGAEEEAAAKKAQAKGHRSANRQARAEEGLDLVDSMGDFPPSGSGPWRGHPDDYNDLTSGTTGGNMGAVFRQ